MTQHTYSISKHTSYCLFYKNVLIFAFVEIKKVNLFNGAMNDKIKM